VRRLITLKWIREAYLKEIRRWNRHGSWIRESFRCSLNVHWTWRHEDSCPAWHWKLWNKCLYFVMLDTTMPLYQPQRHRRKRNGALGWWNKISKKELYTIGTPCLGCGQESS
jgi:hypothetical protein